MSHEIVLAVVALASVLGVVGINQIPDKPDSSSGWKLDKTDVWPQVKGLLIAVGGAASAYLLTKTIPALQTEDSMQNVVLIALLSAGINAFQRWQKDNNG